MAGNGSALPLVVSALVAGMRGVAGFRAPDSTSSGVTVYDSAEVMLTAEDDEAMLVIGWVGQTGTDEAGDAGSSSVVFPATQARQEVGSVRCLAVAQTGDHEDGQVPAVRAQAFAVLDAVDTWLRANPTLGLVPGYRDVFAQIGGIPAWRPYVAEAAGIVVEVEFEIGYRARI